MAVQKNFVIRNGIEVNDNLFVADSETNQVGVGTSSPKYTFEVRGGIGVTNFNAIGISTVNDIQINGRITAGSSSGVAGQYLISTGVGISWSNQPLNVRDTDTQTASPGASTFNTPYTIGLLDVFVNGVKLSENEFAATDSATVTLSYPCFGGETVEFVSYSPFTPGFGSTSLQGITVLEEGSPVGSAAQITSINFVGASVTAVGSGLGVTVYITDSDTTNPNYWLSTVAGIHTLSNVGIGTTNPRFALEVGSVGGVGTALHVNGDVRVAGILTVGSSSITLNGSSNTINVGSGVTIDGNSGTISVSGHTISGPGVTSITAGSGISVNQSTGNVTISAVLNESQWVSTGAGIHTLSNVGIGTTNPTSTLSIEGNANITGVVTASSFVGNLTGTATTATTVDILNTNGLTTVYYPTFVESRTDGQIVRADVDLTYRTDDNILTVPNIQLSSSGLTVGTGGTVVTTTSNGFVGIGSINPTSALTVAGSGTSTSQLYVTGVSTFQNFGYFTNQNRLYFGGTSGTSGSENLSISYEVILGGGNFVQSYNNAPLKLYSNDLTLGSQSGENFATFAANGSASLYYDNSKKFETLGTGVTVTGTTFTNQLSLSGIATFRGLGNTNALIGNTSYYAGILWSGSSGVYGGTEPSILTDSELGLSISGGLGDLILGTYRENGDVIIKAGNFGPTAIKCAANLGVELYYNVDSNSKKFETIGTGVTVTGTTFTNQLSVSGVSTFAGITTVTGPTLFTKQLNVSGITTINNLTIQTGSGTFTASAGIAYTADSYSSSSAVNSEYTLFFQHSTGIQSQKVLVMDDGTTAYSQEYGIMSSNDLLVSIGATIKSGNVELWWTPETGISGIVTYRYTRETLI